MESHFLVRILPAHHFFDCDFYDFLMVGMVIEKQLGFRVASTDSRPIFDEIDRPSTFSKATNDQIPLGML